MGFKRVPINENRKIISSEDNFLGIITGKNDAKFIRNQYQIELDNANAAIVNIVHYIEEGMKKLNGAYDNSQRLKKNIEAHFEERKMLYESLENLLSNEKCHEKEMWFETLKSRIQEVKDKDITVIQKNKDTDIESMNVGSSLDYPIAYPDSKIKQRYEKILKDIEWKERELRKEKEKYNNAVSKYNYYLSFFEKHIKKAEDKFAVYNTIFKEGKQKLTNCRYYQSIYYKLSSEKSKSEVTLDTLSHRVEQFKNTLEIIKRELSQYRGKTFVEMQY